MNLEQFSQWYINNNYPIRIPQDAKVYVTDYTFSIPIFRDGPFQVELYLVKGNTTSPKHYHNAEQISIFLGGLVNTRKGKDISEDPEWGSAGSSNPTYSDFPSKDAGAVGKLLTTDTWHQIRTGNRGAVFLVIQHWDNSEITSAVIDWKGEPIGPEHTNTILNEK